MSISQQKLVLAVENGDAEATERLLAETGPGAASANAVGPDARPLVVAAAYKGHAKVLEKLHRANANLDARDAKGNTALIWAARMKQGTSVRLLLRWGADKDAANTRGNTALHYASAMGLLECVQLLIGWGAARTRNKEGKTADSLAEAEGHTEIAEAFAAAPNSPPPPQTRASFRGRLSAGSPAPKSNATMQQERNTNLALAAKDGRLQDVERLLEEGARPDSVDFDGISALVLAAVGGHLEVLEVLLAAGAKLGTAVVAASAYGQAHCVQALLDLGADVDLPDDHGWTALHYAARYGEMDCVQLLLSVGASPVKFNGLGKTAIDIARECGHSKVSSALRSATSPPRSPQPQAEETSIWRSPSPDRVPSRGSPAPSAPRTPDEPRFRSEPPSNADNSRGVPQFQSPTTAMPGVHCRV